MNTYLVPEKRFSGFNEYWEMKPLGNLITVKSGLGFKAYEYTNDGVRLLQIENVSYGETKWIEPTYLPESYLVKYPDLVLKEGDIVLALNRPVTNGVLKIVKLNKKDSPSILYQRVGKLDFISDNISADYMYQVFTVYVKKFVIRESIGSDQPFISLKSLYKYKVPVTSKEEQQKIADFLSSVDKKIRLLKQKHSLLQQYKKGVMQQLFSQQIRFKDDNGKDFSDWQEKTLADLADKMSNKNKDDTIKKVLTNSAKHGIVNQRDYFDKDIANENNLTNYSIVDKDDFVYNPRISESAPVGPIKRNHIGQGIMSPLYTVFRFKETAYLDYLELFFQTTYWHRYMRTIANFGARHDRMNITMGNFFKLPIDLPGEGEMQKIVAFVTSLNKKVDLVAKQIELTQTFKKGLLQQMFV